MAGRHYGRPTTFFLFMAPPTATCPTSWKPSPRMGFELPLTPKSNSAQGAVDAAVSLCGHTHLQRMMALDDGHLIVNPRSLGLPAYDDDRPHPHVVESGSPHARYAVLSKSKEGWVADLYLVGYDWGAARIFCGGEWPNELVESITDRSRLVRLKTFTAMLNRSARRGKRNFLR